MARSIGDDRDDSLTGAAGAGIIGGRGGAAHRLVLARGTPTVRVLGLALAIGTTVPAWAQGTTGAQANGNSDFPALSADGRFIAFWSCANNLVRGDTNFSYDVFVRDRGAGTTRRVSVSSGEVQGDLTSGGPAISADGRFVAFSSWGGNLVPGDTNNVPDVFIRDRQTGTTRLVSVSSGGGQGDDGSGGGPALSADGRFVAFSSKASNLVPGDTNAWDDVFVRDRGAGTTRRMSVALFPADPDPLVCDGPLPRDRPGTLPARRPAPPPAGAAAARG